MGYSTVLAFFLFLVLRGNIFADGGTVQFSKKAGPLRITVFTTSAIIRAGVEDVSVLVQHHSTYQPLLNAKVWLSLQRLKQQSAEEKKMWVPPCCRMKTNLDTQQEATHTMATNKLLYATPITLPSAGKWEMRVKILYADTLTLVSGVVCVEPPTSPLIDYWPLLLFPIILVISYAVRYHSLVTCRR